MGGHSIWKQQNKQHKTGRHRSKGMVEANTKGRVNIKTISRHKKQEVGRENRRNQARQLRDKKREQILALKRGVGKGNTAPHMVVVIPLHADVDVGDLKDKMESCADVKPHHCETLAAGFTMNVTRFKHRFQVILPQAASLELYQDYARNADTVLFVVNMTRDKESIDEEGVQVLKTLQCSGMSSYMFCGQNLESCPPKYRNEVKSATLKHLKTHVQDVRLQVVESQNEAFSLLRMISECKRKKLGLWDQRSFLLGEKVEYEDGALKVSGYVRNSELDVNRLIHVVGWGNFQIKSVQVVGEPCPYVAKASKAEDTKTRIGDKSYDAYQVIREIAPDSEKQQDLKQEADFDPMDAEQTWPTEDELQQAAMEQVRMLVMKKKAQEGASEYQSEWVMDDGGDWQECSDGEDEDMMSADDDCDSEEDIDEELEREFAPKDIDTESVMNDDTKSVAFSTATQSVMLDDMDQKIDEEDLERFRRRDEQSHEQFPDEVDTPRDMPAQRRFNRYRGMQSFRTTPWDPMEELPQDYARIFRFKNFKHIQKLVKQMKPEESHSVKCGSFVTIHLAAVDEALYNNHNVETTPLSLFSLLPHEQRMSVMHFAIKKINKDDGEIIKSKDRLLFHVGFRKFTAAPIFSEHTSGDKHKMIRYMPNQGVFVATVYAPVTFPPSNVLVYKEGKEDEGPVAVGTLYSVNPNRVIVKRVLLSGHPFKVNKKTAVVRYMFFNPDDVSYFSKIELRTKLGRRGHIKYPVGTHGLMKCVFNDQLTSQDTVLLSLYKRVYPKWTYDQVTPNNKPEESSEMMMME